MQIEPERQDQDRPLTFPMVVGGVKHRIVEVDTINTTAEDLTTTVDIVTTIATTITTLTDTTMAATTITIMDMVVATMTMVVAMVTIIMVMKVVEVATIPVLDIKARKEKQKPAESL